MVLVSGEDRPGRRRGSLLPQALRPNTVCRKTLVSTEASYWKAAAAIFLKPRATSPLKFFTPGSTRGCPYDCGLCPDHEQHSCLALPRSQTSTATSTPAPTCFASSSPARTSQQQASPRSKSLLDLLVESEGPARSSLQISGGEPTAGHPQILDIIRSRRGCGRSAT